MSMKDVIKNIYKQELSLDNDSLKKNFRRKNLKIEEINKDVAVLPYLIKYSSDFNTHFKLLKENNLLNFSSNEKDNEVIAKHLLYAVKFNFGASVPDNSKEYSIPKNKNEIKEYLKNLLYILENLTMSEQFFVSEKNSNGQVMIAKRSFFSSFIEELFDLHLVTDIDRKTVVKTSRKRSGSNIISGDNPVRELLLSLVENLVELEISFEEYKDLKLDFLNRCIRIFCRRMNERKLDVKAISEETLNSIAKTGILQFDYTSYVDKFKAKLNEEQFIYNLG